VLSQQKVAYASAREQRRLFREEAITGVEYL